MGAEASVTVICQLLVQIEFISAAVLPQSWMLTLSALGLGTTVRKGTESKKSLIADLL